MRSPMPGRTGKRHGRWKAESVGEEVVGAAEGRERSSDCESHWRMSRAGRKEIEPLGRNTMDAVRLAGERVKVVGEKASAAEGMEPSQWDDRVGIRKVLQQGRTRQ